VKKIFQIASYDFKRLLLNPITIIGMIMVLAVCLLTGYIHKIPTSPEYKANIAGETTNGVYENFKANVSENETKISYDLILNKAKNLIAVQTECQDYVNLQRINDEFKKIKIEIKKYKENPSLGNKYTQENNIDEITQQVTKLQNFLIRYENLNAFECKLIFKSEQYSTLKDTTNFFIQTISKHTSIINTMNILAQNITQFDILNEIISKPVDVRNINSLRLQQWQEEYILKAENKLTKISAEMNNLNEIAIPGTQTDMDNREKMLSLATNYKLTCESAFSAIYNELAISLHNHLGGLDGLYNYKPIKLEDTNVALTKAKYFLNDNSLYYTKTQEPLNFNTASSQVSAYDHAYFIIAIIGFLNVLFGCFCAYKLFGRDRKNGKMDVILSQNVTFGQVFAGKFIAIVFITSFMLAVYSIISVASGLIFYPQLSGQIFAVFNLNSAYTIHPFLFLLIKIFGIEFQVVFYSILTIFLMNVSRKFEIFFGISLAIFAIATICNIFLNGQLVYCLFPFIHADLTSFIGGGTMNTGFLVTSLYAYGNFFISLVYYLVVVTLLYNFTNQLFKRN